MKKGKLIVIEGSCDGVGKSTQITLLKKRLESLNYDVITHHFPSYGEPQAVPIEMHLKAKLGKKEELSPYLINSMVAIDRAITWNLKLKKEYEKGTIVLLDRYTQSSMIYQSALFDDLKDREKFIDYVDNYEFNLLEIKKPDAVIFLNAPYSVIKTFNTESSVKDEYEKDEFYMNKVSENANFVADYRGWSKINYIENGKLKTIEEINNEIFNIVEKELDI